MKHFLKSLMAVWVFTSLVQADSQFCGARLSREDQNKLYAVALTALEESFQDMKAADALMAVEALKKRKPQRLHVVGTELKKAKGKIHMSLCYNDGSNFLKCSEIFKHIGANKKLSDVYDDLISEPIRVQDVAMYGKFVGFSIDPKQLMFDGKPVTGELHISLIKIRENPDLQAKLLEKLKSKIKDIGPFTLEKASCRLERKEAEYIKGQGKEYRIRKETEPLKNTSISEVSSTK